MATAPPADAYDALVADAEARGIGELLDEYGDQLSEGDVKDGRRLVGAVIGAGWSAPTTQASRLAELRDSSSVRRLRQVAEAEREAVMARMQAAAAASPGAVIVDRGLSIVADTATRTLRRIERSRGARILARPNRDRRPARQARSTRTRTISRNGSTRRTTTSGRSPDDPSSPGDPDPPPGLRRLDGGREQSRDSKLNQAWQVILELDLSPVELETLGEYCRIRSEWEGRWAA